MISKMNWMIYDRRHGNPFARCVGLIQEIQIKENSPSHTWDRY